MKTLSPLLLFCLLVNVYPCFSQNTSDSIEGNWKGTSICQQKNSPCHDEVVVYHIKKGDKADTYIIQANKIVNGKEEEMGTLDFIYNKSKQSLTCKMIDRQQRESLWEFTIKGNHMSGTLIVNSETLYRKIEVTKE